MIKWLGRIGFGLVVLLALFATLSVVSRFLTTLEFLASGQAPAVPPEFPQAADFNLRYNASPYATLAHILTGLVFMLLGPIQFVPAVRNRWIRFHRWSGRIWMIAALVGALSALWFVWQLPVFGSFATKVGVVVASTLFLICLVQGYRSIRRREIARHREWMIRTFAIGLGISTFRLLIPLLMLPPLGATFPEAWDAAVWLAFTLHAVAAEVWINLTRKQPRGEVPAPKAGQAPRRERLTRGRVGGASI